MSGCYGNEGAFYYLDVFVNTAPHRLARPNKDYANYYAKDYADFGLPKGSDLRMWATPQATVKVRSPNGRPNLARLLKGIKDLAAREHVDFIITDLPEMHQIIPQSTAGTTTAAAQVVAWAEEMAALNVTVGAHHTFAKAAGSAGSARFTPVFWLCSVLAVPDTRPAKEAGAIQESGSRLGNR